MFEVDDIDINQESNYKKSSDIYLGVKATAHLIKGPLDAETENRLKNNCLKFLVELCNQFKKRFFFNSDSLITKLNVLEPNESFTQNHSPLSIISLAAHFPMLVPEDNLNDWTTNGGVTAQMLTIYRPLATTFYVQYWYRLRNIKDRLQNLKYGILSDFMIVLPHSSAALSAFFSSLNCIKTRQRNSLKSETVKNRILQNRRLQEEIIFARHGLQVKNWCLIWKPGL